MPNTYVALETVTLTSPVSSVTFNVSGLPYTDLVIVAQAKSSTAGSSVNSYRMRFNGLSTALYSNTSIQPSGSSSSSTRDTNSSEMYVGLLNQTSANPESSIIHIMNYANTNVFKTVLARGASTAGSVNAIVGLWRSTAAITSIELFMTSATLTGTFSLYGIANADQGAAKATGGMITEDSQYWYHTFGASGTFTPKQALTCDYLVVAGGGGGGRDGGGGGAGGLRSTVTATGGGGSLESAISVLSGTPYSITVGGGGNGGSTGVAATNGVNSVFSTITSTGGGGGGGDTGTATGFSGGSGGGTKRDTTDNTGGGARTVNQGFAGGVGCGTSFGGAGGGGGAGAAGGKGVSTGTSAGERGGAGGNGVTISITGTSVTYAGGGGGANFGSAVVPLGGTGGGGNGGAQNFVGGQSNPTAPTVGTANTGGGGGGGAIVGANGGSGIVVIRYAK